jgi:polysaccharide pyruvyl transferase WcaK-like protein
MHDIAFTFPSGEPDLPKSLLSTEGSHAMRKKIGITIISAMPSYIPADVIDNYYKCLAEFIEYLINQFSCEVYIFYQVTGPSTDENDALGSDKVLSRLNAKEKEYVHVEKDLHSAFELKAAYGLMDIFIASRLHSGIFSLAKHTPTLFIGYLYKTKGVLNSIGLDDLFVNIFDVSTPTLIRLINNLWDNQESYEQQIHSAMNQIETDLSQFPHEIKKVLYSDDN